MLAGGGQQPPADFPGPLLKMVAAEGDFVARDVVGLCLSHTIGGSLGPASRVPLPEGIIHTWKIAAQGVQ